MNLLWGGGTQQSVWALLPSRPPEHVLYYVKGFSDRLDNSSDHEPWKGMRRVDVPWGATLNYWGDGSSQIDPDTIIEFCVYSDIAECPQH
jgi:hypothetical protein